MGERCVRNAEVRGSIPLSSTIINNGRPRFYANPFGRLFLFTSGRNANLTPGGLKIAPLSNRRLQAFCAPWRAI